MKGLVKWLVPEGAEKGNRNKTRKGRHPNR